jgi:ABC-type protease/lipase transport system fused ATPase/permease subunit
MQVCADTVVGGGLLRGVSGGQRKRVTTGELMVGPAKTLLMDEISTGLDSSTTYLIVRCIRNYVHLLEVRHTALLGCAAMVVAACRDQCPCALLSIIKKRALLLLWLLPCSNTTSFCALLRATALLPQGTVLMSLLQPPPEVFELFDDVMLLSEGQMVYHGPREDV